MKKEILKEDLKDLRYLVNKYNAEKQYDKASECMKEIVRIEKELKKNEHKEVR